MSEVVPPEAITVDAWLRLWDDEADECISVPVRVSPDYLERNAGHWVQVHSFELARA